MLISKEKKPLNIKPQRSPDKKKEKKLSTEILVPAQVFRQHCLLEALLLPGHTQQNYIALCPPCGLQNHKGIWFCFYLRCLELHLALAK